MSDIKRREVRALAAVSSLVLSCCMASPAFAGINGTGAQGINGTGVLGINGTGAQGINGTGVLGINGTGAQGINGTGVLGINGTGAQGINGTGLEGINGTGDLLVVGRVDFVSSDFASVLGQSIFGKAGDFAALSVGDTVAVYGSLDWASGGIQSSALVPVSRYEAGAFLTGYVDEVNQSMGIAVVSGIAVDYTALLSDGAAPRVGERMSFSGRVYSGRGLVAEPR